MKLQGICRRWLLALALSFFGALSWATESPLDLNRADAQQLEAVLQGVGPAKAAAIVRYRDENGPFQTIEQLLEVKGIGPSLLEKNRQRLSVSQK